MLGLLIGFGFWQRAQKKADAALDALEEVLRLYAEALALRPLPLSENDKTIIRQELDMIKKLGLGDEQKGNA
jgi:hypothetical protein